FGSDEGVVGDAIARSKDEGIRRTISDSYSGGEASFADGNPAVLRNRGDATDENLIGIGIVSFDPAVRARRHGKVFPTHSVIERQFCGEVPAIAYIEAIELCPQVVLIRRLIGPAVERG